MSAADLAWLAARVSGAQSTQTPEAAQAAAQAAQAAQTAQVLQQVQALQHAAQAAQAAQALQNAQTMQALQLWAAQAAQAAGTAQASTATVPAPQALPAAVMMADTTNWAAQFAGFQQNKHLDAQAMLLQGLAGGSAASMPASGGGGGGAKSKGPFLPKGQSDAIYIALNTAMQTVPPEDLVTNEGDWDPDALKLRLTKYFRSAAKHVSFEGEYDKVINNFADTALNNVSWALQGTKWLPKADFTLVLEVAVGELFPESFMERIPGSAKLQEAILKAHDRALEEARFAPFFQDTVKSMISGKKAQNKVFNAGEAARKEVVAKLTSNQDDPSLLHDATENGVMGKVQAFSFDWITATINALGDWPETTLECDDAIKIFDKLLSSEESCLPRCLVQYMVEPLPHPWDFVATNIKGLYAIRAEKNAEATAASASSKKRKRHEGPNFMYKTDMCRNMTQTGFCKMGDWCVFAHDPSELAIHKGSIKGNPAAFKGGIYPVGDPGEGKGSGKGHGKEFGNELARAMEAEFGKGPAKGPQGKGYDDFSIPTGEFDDGYGKGGGKDSWSKGPPQYGAPAAAPFKGKGMDGNAGKSGKGPIWTPSDEQFEGGQAWEGDGESPGGQWDPSGGHEQSEWAPPAPQYDDGQPPW